MHTIAAHETRQPTESAVEREHVVYFGHGSPARDVISEYLRSGYDYFPGSHTHRCSVRFQGRKEGVTSKNFADRCHEMEEALASAAMVLVVPWGLQANDATKTSDVDTFVASVAAQSKIHLVTALFTEEAVRWFKQLDPTIREMTKHIVVGSEMLQKQVQPSIRPQTTMHLWPTSAQGKDHQESARIARKEVEAIVRATFR